MKYNERRGLDDDVTPHDPVPCDAEQCGVDLQKYNGGAGSNLCVLAGAGSRADRRKHGPGRPGAVRRSQLYRAGQRNEDHDAVDLLPRLARQRRRTSNRNAVGGGAGRDAHGRWELETALRDDPEDEGRWGDLVGASGHEFLGPRVFPD